MYNVKGAAASPASPCAGAEASKRTPYTPTLGGDTVNLSLLSLLFADYMLCMF